MFHLFLSFLQQVPVPVVPVAPVQTENVQTAQLLQIISHFMASGTMSILIVQFIQWLKTSSLAPWFTHETSVLNNALSVFLAFITSIGIAYTYNAGVVTITFTVVTVLHGLWHFAQQYALNHFVYHGFIKPKTVEVAPAAPAAAAINPPPAHQ